MRYHLATLLVCVMVAGVLLWLNMTPWSRCRQTQFQDYGWPISFYTEELLQGILTDKWFSWGKLVVNVFANLACVLAVGLFSGRVLFGKPSRTSGGGKVGGPQSGEGKSSREQLL